VDFTLYALLLQVLAAIEADQTLAFGLRPHCGSALARALTKLSKAH
jgi:hypothetical protein